MRDAIIVDLDGTLADNSHRVHHIKKEPKYWDVYNGLIKGDECNEWCNKIIKKFYVDNYVLIVTGRMQTKQIEKDTIRWLYDNNIPYDKIFFRKDQDFREDSIVKLEIYEQHIELNYKVLFVLDDRPRVVDMWRKIGLVCLQPNFVPH